MAIAASSHPRSALARQGGALDDAAKLLLRLSLGGLMLMHGINKVTGGIDPILGIVSQAGLPSAVAYLVYVGELVAPLLLILGAWTRAAAVVLAVNMVVAVALVHVGQLGALSRGGGWAIELQAFYVLTALTVALQGAGRYSAGGIDGRWN